MLDTCNIIVILKVRCGGVAGGRGGYIIVDYSRGVPGFSRYTMTVIGGHSVNEMSPTIV